MTKQSTLTIVIPAYNEASNLARCLDTIAHQTITPDRVVIVNNNSTDNTAAVARMYPFVTVIDEPKQGIAYAHQAGFNYATTELIARIDAETLLPPDWVNQVQKFYSANSAQIALVGSGYFYNLKSPRITTLVINHLFRSSKMLLGHHPLWGPNFVLPHSAWQKVKDTLHFEANIFDDLDLSLHLHAAKCPIVWKNSIKVGVQLRHCDSLGDFYKYSTRWPRTLKLHRDPRWAIAWLALTIELPFQYALLRLLRYPSKVN